MKYSSNDKYRVPVEEECNCRQNKREEVAAMAANHSDNKKKKKNSVQQDEVLQTTKSKIRQFLSPGTSQPTQQVKSAPQSPVNHTRRKKVVSVAYLEELQQHINDAAPSRPALSSYSGPRSSPHRPRPTPPPPYKSAPNILHPVARPSSPSIPPRSTISKKADFKNDKGIYVVPISPQGGSSPTKISPTKTKSFDNPPQKVSSGPPLRRQDDMTNSLQLTRQGIPISSGNVRKQSACLGRTHIYDELHSNNSWRSQGGSLSLDSGQYTDDGYERIDEFKKVHDNQGTVPFYSNVTGDYDDIKSVMESDSNGYLVLCKSKSADDAEDEDADYSYARIDGFLTEKGEIVKPSDDKDAYYGYEALHYSQLSI